jgi:hypothetical protein
MRSTSRFSNHFLLKSFQLLKKFVGNVLAFRRKPQAADCFPQTFLKAETDVLVGRTMDFFEH